MSVGRSSSLTTPLRVAVVNPVTATEEAAILTGDLPNRIALSGDGQYLYVGLDEAGMIRRFQMSSLTVDQNIPLPPGDSALAMLVLPNQPDTILVARGDVNRGFFEFAVYDHQVPLPSTVIYSPGIAGSPASLYINPVNGKIYGYANGHFFLFSLSSTGLTQVAMSDGFPSLTTKVLWGPGLAGDDAGNVFDLDAWALVGSVYPPSSFLHAIVIGAYFFRVPLWFDLLVAALLAIGWMQLRE